MLRVGVRCFAVFGPMLDGFFVVVSANIPFDLAKDSEENFHVAGL